jgi:hypothetical protein
LGRTWLEQPARRAQAAGPKSAGVLECWGPCVPCVRHHRFRRTASKAGTTASAAAAGGLTTKPAAMAEGKYECQTRPTSSGVATSGTIGAALAADATSRSLPRAAAAAAAATATSLPPPRRSWGCAAAPCLCWPPPARPPPSCCFSPAGRGPARAVSIINFVIRTGVTEVNLSQYGPIPRWKRPAHGHHPPAAAAEVASRGRRCLAS